MRISHIAILTGFVLAAGLAGANTVWVVNDPNAAANGYSNWLWTDAGVTNWNNGIPTDGTGINDGKAVLNDGTKVECRVDSAVSCKHLVMGDGGSNPGAVLRIVNGGSLYAAGSDWNAIGYSRSTTMIVEKGGTFESGGRVIVGGLETGESHLIVDGGHVIINGTFQVASHDATHDGFVTVTNDGLVEVNGGLEFNTAAGYDSIIDVGFGRVTFNQNIKAQVDNLVASNKVIAFGGAGSVKVTYANGKTTITGIHPMNPDPYYNETVLAGDVDLSWTNLSPVAPATDVFVDVWFGSDPNKLGLNFTKVVTAGKNTSSVTVSAPSITEPTTYYWQVNSYVNGAGHINDANMIEGEIFKFDVTNNTQPSVVIETPPTATWINVPIQLDSTVDDDHPEQVTYLWTATAGGVPMTEPNVIFSPSNTAADPTVTVNYHSGPFTVTVTVNDGFNPDAFASVTHDCADNPCQAAVSVIHLNDLHPADIVVDCKIDLTDFAAVARQWLTDYALTEPVPMP